MWSAPGLGFSERLRQRGHLSSGDTFEGGRYALAGRYTLDLEVHPAITDIALNGRIVAKKDNAAIVFRRRADYSRRTN